MKRRVFDIAKELGLPSKVVLEKLVSKGIDVKSHMSMVDESVARALMEELTRSKAPAPSPAPKAKELIIQAPAPKAPMRTPAPVAVTPPAPIATALKVSAPVQAPARVAVADAPPPVSVPEPVLALPPQALEPIPSPGIPAPIHISELLTVGEMAQQVGMPPADLIKQLMLKGKFVTINQNVTKDLIELTSAVCGRPIVTVSATTDDDLVHEMPAPTRLVPRPPIVTIMGHVDHGKTSLLDAIRQTTVAARESGGITQHIGAYTVSLPKGSVTFIDTPGHEAFTRLRARGAQVTDVVVLVVAADDGVMPQTIEAIDHAKAANVPILVAVNKMDKADANADRVKRELSEHGLTPEDWGGRTIFVEVSAKKNMGLDRLLELLLLEADLLELRADPDIPARGVVLEARMDKTRGPVATVIVQQGTLRVGDSFVSGTSSGKVKALVNDVGKRIPFAPPAMAIEILGYTKVPNPGDTVLVVKDDKMARQIALRREVARQGSAKPHHVTLEDLFQRVSAGEIRELRLIVKADVSGSIEALTTSLVGLSTDKVRLAVIHAGVGNINESDIMLAAASDAVVLGFRVKTEPRAEEISRTEGVECKAYDIIYNAVNDVKAAMEGLLEPTVKEVLTGEAEVRQLFKVSKVGLIIGSKILQGKLTRGDMARVIRAGATIYAGKISTLKRFKDDVKEVAVGYECGIGIEGTLDVQVGDRIQGYVEEKVKSTL